MTNATDSVAAISLSEGVWDALSGQLSGEIYVYSGSTAPDIGDDLDSTHPCNYNDLCLSADEAWQLAVALIAAAEKVDPRVSSAGTAHMYLP